MKTNRPFSYCKIICVVGVLLVIVLKVEVASQKPESKVRASFDNSEDDTEVGLDILLKCNVQSTVSFGLNAQIGKNSWIALLVYSNEPNESFLCGGSLIAVQYVLTAAHCIFFKRTSLVKVRLGEHDTEEDPDCIKRGFFTYCQNIQEIGIEEAIYHKDFSISTGANDIGLIRLQRPADLKINVNTICLPMPWTGNLNFQKTVIAGWGIVETGLKARILQQAEVPFSDDPSHCVDTPVTDKQICLRTENRINSCFGDSGGPLVRVSAGFFRINIIQVGIVSSGGSECGSGKPSIFTKVQPYINWIAGNMRRQGT